MKFLLTILAITFCIPTAAFSATSLSWSFAPEDAISKAKEYVKENKIDDKDYSITEVICIDCEDILSEYKNPQWRIKYSKTSMVKGGYFFISIDRAGKTTANYGE
jgi:hypothetical protein